METPGQISAEIDTVEEFWAVIGRRGGKTRAMAILAAYLAACVDHRDTLAPGERGVIPLLAASVQQAASAFAFIEGIFAVAPHLKDLVAGATSDTLSLTTGIDIQVRPASFRTIRGIAAVGAIADEIAFGAVMTAPTPTKKS
jgi:phage terminase large subunit-like protein